MHATYRLDNTSFIQPRHNFVPVSDILWRLSVIAPFDLDESVSLVSLPAFRLQLVYFGLEGRV